MKKNKPTIVFTGDLDWASEDCLNYYLNSLNSFGIKPLVFATHNSKILKKFQKKNLVDVGLHPNFKKNSTQGNTKEEIINNLIDLYPKTNIFRCHGFQDSYEILNLFSKKNFNFDSNELIYMNKNIQPIKKNSNITRLPVYWSDGLALLKITNNYNLIKDFQINKKNIFSDGLKIFNIHPFNYCFNFETIEQYMYCKKYTKIANKNLFLSYSKNNQFGIRDYINQIIKLIIDRGYSFCSFEDLLKIYNY
tara:strand:+ start:24182 stop:24928 length:747 start_codon:yes stop_codon:yes gene_type:complete